MTGLNKICITCAYDSRCPSSFQKTAVLTQYRYLESRVTTGQCVYLYVVMKFKGSKNSVERQCVDFRNDPKGNCHFSKYVHDYQPVQ